MELQIDRVVAVDGAEATVTVRCLSGPVSRDARVTGFGGSETIDLRVARILVYGHDVEALDSGVTALVTLHGEDVRRLRSGTPTDGWQVLSG
ncbi:hypothetical protein ACFQ1S_44640 [Kibdelosporangium lantanae]|uniref:Uncharacterized protein n=1 Tax=Kibdelosporangium lantanae TaxID=1497396 RepID=A0ABW3MNK2_9PSEU